MKYEIGGLSNRRAMIWLDEFPFEAYTPTEWLQADKEGFTDKTIRWNSACLELNIHVGGRMRYGLAGATFAKEQNDTTSINVGIYSTEDRPYQSTIHSGYGEEVFVGLPGLGECSFAKGVMKGLTEGIDELGRLPSGTLTVGHAVHATVSSSQYDMYQVSKALLTLFLADEKFYTKENLKEFIGSLR